MFMLNGGFILTLMGVTATAIMLLVVANVSMLLLARASENTREVAIRSALGAPRSALIGQTLSESLLLCVSGSVLGICVCLQGPCQADEMEVVAVLFEELLDGRMGLPAVGTLEVGDLDARGPGDP